VQAQAWSSAHYATIDALAGGVATEKAQQRVQAAIARSSAIPHPGSFPDREGRSFVKVPEDSQTAPLLTDCPLPQKTLPGTAEYGIEPQSVASPLSVEGRTPSPNVSMQHNSTTAVLTPKLAAQSFKSREERAELKAQREADKAAKLQIKAAAAAEREEAKEAQAAQKAAAKAFERAEKLQRQQEAAEKRQRREEAVASKAKYAAYAWYLL
jgi:hypothetical protein